MPLFFKRFLCWFGVHHWSMPGGWCEDCGVCDLFFGCVGHEDCGDGPCQHWIREQALKQE
jgi:hypothetical protein